jgi:hypothetical protein
MRRQFNHEGLYIAKQVSRKISIVADRHRCAMSATPLGNAEKTRLRPMTRGRSFIFLAGRTDLAGSLACGAFLEALLIASPRRRRGHCTPMAADEALGLSRRSPLECSGQASPVPQ